jgi:sugar phosphate permease
MVCTSLGAYYGITSPFFYFFLFGLNGLLQSCGFPTCVAIFTNWFGKKGRGKLFGLWCSTGSAGNIIGALLTSLFTSTFEMRWYVAYGVMGFTCLFMALLNGMFLIVHPIDVDIHIDEIDEELNENERLLSASINGSPSSLASSYQNNQPIGSRPSLEERRELIKS